MIKLLCELRSLRYAGPVRACGSQIWAHSILFSKAKGGVAGSYNPRGKVSLFLLKFLLTVLFLSLKKLNKTKIKFNSIIASRAMFNHKSVAFICTNPLASSWGKKIHSPLIFLASCIDNLSKHKLKFNVLNIKLFLFFGK